MKISQGNLGKFSIYSNLFSEEPTRLGTRGDHSHSNIEKILERANIDGVYFISDSNVVLLNHLSLNNLSEAAGQFIHHLLTDFSDTVGDGAEQFFRRIVKSTIGMAASKMLNPKRKCLTFEHMLQHVESNRHKKLPPHLREKRESYRTCLKFHSWMAARISSASDTYVRMPKSIWQADEQLNYEVSRTIGLLLGYLLYSGVMSNKIPGSWLKNLYRHRLETISDIWGVILKLYRRTNSAKKIAL